MLRWNTLFLVAGVVAASSRSTGAQMSQCATDRIVSTLVGAGLGGAVAAMPATVIHRHDQAASRHIVEVSIPVGAVLGFALSGRDGPCTAQRDAAHVADGIVSSRASHAHTGAIVVGVAGAIAGAVGSTFLTYGCAEGGSCRGQRIEIGMAMAGVGGVSGGILGGLIGWAMPAGRTER